MGGTEKEKEEMGETQKFWLCTTQNYKISYNVPAANSYP